MTEKSDIALLVLSSIQIIIIIFILAVVLLVLVSIRKIIVFNKKTKTGKQVNQQKDNTIEVVVQNDGKAYDLNLKSDPKTLYNSNQQKTAMKANESFQTKASKVSNGLESIPLSTTQVSTISSDRHVSRQLMSQLSARFDRQTDDQTNVRQSRDNSLLSDTMDKIDEIIDKTFDSIIDSIEYLDQRSSSDEE